MKKIKKLGYIFAYILLFFICLDWIIGVKKINSASRIETKFYELNQPIFIGDISYTPLTFKIYDNDEYYKEYGVQLDAVTEDMMQKALVLRFEVKNESNRLLSLSEALSVTGVGFESIHWYSSSDPFMAKEINRYHFEEIKAGESIYFDMPTTINSNCFSENGWKNIEKDEYYYSMSLYPEPVKIKIGRPERP